MILRSECSPQVEACGSTACDAYHGYVHFVAYIITRITVVRVADFVCVARGFNPGRVVDDSVCDRNEMVSKWLRGCTRLTSPVEPTLVA